MRLNDIQIAIVSGFQPNPIWLSSSFRQSGRCAILDFVLLLVVRHKRKGDLVLQGHAKLAPHRRKHGEASRGECSGHSTARVRNTRRKPGSTRS